MFRNLTSQLAAAASGDEAAKKVLSPSLRPDIYNLIDTTKLWIIGGLGGGYAGDGVSYGPLLVGIQKHLPETKKPGLESFGQAEGEIAVIVGGITNMILELSKWEGMSAGMAMRTWVDSLVEAHKRASSGPTTSQTRTKGGDLIAKGITRGLNQYTDVTLLTKDLTTRIQIISCLKTGEFVFELETKKKRFWTFVCTLWLYLLLCMYTTSVRRLDPKKKKKWHGAGNHCYTPA